MKYGLTSCRMSRMRNKQKMNNLEINYVHVSQQTNEYSWEEKTKSLGVTKGCITDTQLKYITQDVSLCPFQIILKPLPLF